MNKKEVQRTKRISLRVTEVESEKYKEKAKIAGLNLSDYIRELFENGQVILSEKSLTDSNKTVEINQKLKLLIGMGNNLNQLTKYTHQDKKLHTQVENLISRIDEILLSNNL